MLIDNRGDSGRSGNPKTVADFIRKYTDPAHGRAGALDAVTGYFTIAGLAFLHRELSPDNAYRLVLSELAGHDDLPSRVVDLLQGDAGIEASLNVAATAKDPSPSSGVRRSRSRPSRTHSATQRRTSTGTVRTTRTTTS